MGNILEFAIGIVGMGKFADEFDFGGAKLLEFLGITETVKYSLEHISEAISKGAELKSVAAGLNTTAGNLYKVEHALEGIAAASDPKMLFLQMEKALSGVNDQGQRTDILFNKIGLNFAKLRSEGTVQALTDTATALGRLNSNQAAGVVEMLFGRFNAETILQMARNMDLFKREMSESSQTAGLLDKFANTFLEVKADWGDIQNDVLGMWVTIAGEIAPAFQSAFGKIHDDIKDLGPAIFSAIQEGRISELVQYSLAAAFEQGGYYGARVFDTLAVGFGDAVFAALKLAIEQIVPMWWNGIMHAGRIAMDREAISALQAKNTMDAFSISHETGTSDAARKDRIRFGSDILHNDRSIAILSQMMDSEMNEDATDFHSKVSAAMKSLGTSIQDGLGDVIKAWNSTTGNAPHAAMDNLKLFIKTLSAAEVPIAAANLGRFLATFNAGFLPGALGLLGAGDTSKKDDPLKDILEGHNWHQAFTSLEKMGFVMNLGGRSNMDVEKVTLLTQIRDGVNSLSHHSEYIGINPPGTHAQ